MMTGLPLFPATPRQKNCSKCGAGFTCGPEQGRERCWCDGLPHVPLVAGEDQDCLCPACLRAAISSLNSHRPDFADARPAIKAD
jgi:hypothetical protein